MTEKIVSQGAQAHTPTPHYEFEAVYQYAQGERYNSGRGLAVLDTDLDRLNAIFDGFLLRDESYALAIRNLSTGETVRAHSDTAAARASGARAYRARAILAKVQS